MRIVKKPRRRRRKEEKNEEDQKTGRKLKEWIVKTEIGPQNKSNIDREVIGRIDRLKESLGLDLRGKKEEADLTKERKKKDNFKRIREVFE